MEILHRKALPGLHHSAAAAWSGSNNAAAGDGGNCRRNCGVNLPLPIITSWARGKGLGFPSILPGRSACRCCSSGGGDGLKIRVCNAPWMAPGGVCSAPFGAELCEHFHGKGQTFRVGVSREALVPVCGVVHFRFRGSGRGRAVIVAVSSLNGSHTSVAGEGNVDLELEVFKFMQQSRKPDVFPSRRDLISAGRTDLARAIVEDGGWLAAGWDDEEVDFAADGRSTEATSAVEEVGNGSSPLKRSRRKYKARSLKRSNSTAAGKPARARIGELSNGNAAEQQLNGYGNGARMVREVDNAVDDNDGRGRNGNQLTMLHTDGSEPFEDFQMLERALFPSYNGESAAVRGTRKSSGRGTKTVDVEDAERISSLSSFTKELTLNKSQGERQWGRRNSGLHSASNDFARSATEASVSAEAISENGSPTEASVESPHAEGTNGAALPKRKRNPRKKAQAKVVEGASATCEANGSLDSITGLADSATETTIPSKAFSENGFPAEASVEVLQEEDRNVAAVPKRKRAYRKKARAKVVEDTSATDEGDENADWIHEIFDKRKSMMLDLRSKSSENSVGAGLGVDSNFVQNRLHSLAASLVDTRAALQSGREALWHADEVHQGALSDFIDAEDSLEFRENEIMQARNELLTTRAQVAAVEGNLEVEIMEARKILEEKSMQAERIKGASKHLRTACVVWPNHGNEVFLTGSFNGWSSQIKMEKSTAGVFVVSLPLYPGKYEVKFVVDGSWRVDTLRPIVYVGGFENNILTVT